jgi:hypothetical protein
VGPPLQPGDDHGRERDDGLWVAERRGLERFRTEQPCYSILNRGIESEVLPVAQRYGMGTLVWGPLGQGMLTGRIRKGQQTDLRRAALPFLKVFSDERRLDAVEQIIPLAAEAGLPMTHLAMAFTIAHPGVTSALLGPRTMKHLADLLAGFDVTLTDEILDRIDEIVPPGTDVATLDQAYLPPALQRSNLRRRPVNERAAAVAGVVRTAARFGRWSAYGWGVVVRSVGDRDRRDRVGCARLPGQPCVSGAQS